MDRNTGVIGSHRSFWSLLILGRVQESSGMLNKNSNSEASTQARLIRTSGMGPGRCMYESSSRDSDVQPG